LTRSERIDDVRREGCELSIDPCESDGWRSGGRGGVTVGES